MFELSVVIPVYNHLDLTKQVISNIKETQKDVNYQLVIVNDGSSDWTKKRLDDNKESNWIVVHQANQWTNWAWNKWVELSKAPYILIINNDIILSEWAFRNMINWFTDDSIWMVNVRTISPETKQYWTKPYYFANEIQWWCYMITKKMKELLFPIDKRLRIWWWDNIIFYKMIYNWYKLKVVSNVIIQHLVSQTVSSYQNNTDTPIFHDIMKEEWYYCHPLKLCSGDMDEDFIYWL